ncbi:hypothetical protein QR190_23240, partial [Salmonella enterica]|nr:hypothetical protein [Salmonella enterica]
RNYEGVVKTWRSLRNLARDPGLSFEWIVVDGGSEDGTETKKPPLQVVFSFTEQEITTIVKGSQEDPLWIATSATAECGARSP